MSQTDLAERVGVIKQTVSHWEVGKNRVPIEKITPLANALHTTSQWLLFGEDSDTLPAVPVVGAVKRGGSVQMSEGSTALAPIPPGASGEALEAFRIEASSLAKFNIGDVVYVTRDDRDEHSACFGRACIVELEDGRAFLRIVEPGDDAGLVILTADTAPEIRNVRMRRCRPVLFAMFA